MKMHALKDGRAVVVTKDGKEVDVSRDTLDLIEVEVADGCVDGYVDEYEYHVVYRISHFKENDDDDRTKPDCRNCKHWNGIASTDPERLPGCTASGCPIDEFPVGCEDFEPEDGECVQPSTGVRYPGHQRDDRGRCVICGD